MAAKNKVDVYQQVTDAFLASLRDNKIPWRRPWNPLGPHQNYVSKRPYRGVNPLLLQASADAQEFSSPYWLTYKQADSLSCKQWCKENGIANDKTGYKKYKQECHKQSASTLSGVRKDEKATMITYWTMFKGDSKDKVDEYGNPEKVMIPYLKYIYVFNTEQTDLGLVFDKPEEIEFNPIERADEIINEWEDKPEITHAGDRAFYRPSTDSITMPKRETFHSEEEYYKTLFHESIHATGHKSRLNRIKGDSFGDEKYSFEELIAEIGANFLTNICEIDNDDMTTNSVAYINGWISKLEDDKKLIVKASGKAQKACDTILGVEYTPEKTWKKEGES